jgi:hypothetical protein
MRSLPEHFNNNKVKHQIHTMHIKKMPMPNMSWTYSTIDKGQERGIAGTGRLVNNRSDKGKEWRLLFVCLFVVVVVAKVVNNNNVECVSNVEYVVNVMKKEKWGRNEKDPSKKESNTKVQYYKGQLLLPPPQGHCLLLLLRIFYFVFLFQQIQKTLTGSYVGAT